ncbi:MAG TPA: class I SAM-dependent rRNA methyltransferase [Myxococcales bacterium]|nr:class I SAM-dependent rRNA methyltransferase [Myxococcales bacterium]
MGLVKLELQKDLARHLRGGHPWIYKRAVERPPAGLLAGAIVDVTAGGKFVARGYYDPEGAVRVRVLTRDPAEAIGPLFWRRRIAGAVALRRAWVLGEGTDCARLVHGEGDGLPGVVIDLYGRFAVLKLYSAGLAPHRGAILEALRGEVALDGIYGRDEEIGHASQAPDEEDELSDRDSPPARGQVLWGREPPAELVVREHGMAIAVDVRAGQKTGYFLDQRENRFALRRYARGRTRALNCFSYSGGFSVSAALGGAREVISVDRDASAIKLARRNFELNGLDPAQHGFETADVLEFLRDAGARRFDLIVLDPPAFAKTQKAVPAALDGYASLHRAALSALSQGGILATASCSARVSPEEFVSAIREAALKTHADLQLLEERRQPPDHPALLAFPEGKYLKFFVFRKGA